MSQVEHHGLNMPTGIEDRRRLKAGLEEVVNALAMIKSQQDQKKAVIEVLATEFDMPKPLLARVAKAMYNEEYQKVLAEAEDFETMVETLKLTSSLPATTKLESDQLVG